MSTKGANFQIHSERLLDVAGVVVHGLILTTLFRRLAIVIILPSAKQARERVCQDIVYEDQEP